MDTKAAHYDSNDTIKTPQKATGNRRRSSIMAAFEDIFIGEQNHPQEMDQRTSNAGPAVSKERKPSKRCLKIVTILVVVAICVALIAALSQQDFQGMVFHGNHSGNYKSHQHNQTKSPAPTEAPDPIDESDLGGNPNASNTNEENTEEDQIAVDEEVATNGMEYVDEWEVELEEEREKKNITKELVVPEREVQIQSRPDSRGGGSGVSQGKPNSNPGRHKAVHRLQHNDRPQEGGQ